VKKYKSAKDKGKDFFDKVKAQWVKKTY